MEEIVFFRLWKWKSLGHVQLFATPWTLQSMEFSRPGYCVGSRLCVLSYSEETCFSFDIFNVLTLTDVAYSRNTKSRVEPADWCPAKRFPCRLCVCVCVCVCVLITLSCPTPWDPTDCCPLGFSVHGILQARILRWIAIPFSRGSSQPRVQNLVSCKQADSLLFERQGETDDLMTTGIYLVRT